MAVQFVVSSLGGERVCEVAGELEWTGLQLKVAVEEATNAALIVCEQDLSIGPSRVAHTSVLGDLVAAAEWGAGQPVQVSYLKREEPRILRDCADRRRLSQSLLAFAGSPTRLLFCSGQYLAVDIACTEEHDEGQLRVLPMRAAEDLGFLPLSVFGLAEADVSAILCLAGAFELIGDGTDGLAFAFQLTCGDVVGGFMYICEAMSTTTFLPLSVSVCRRAATAAELLEAMPELLGGPRRDGAPSPGPLHITVDAVHLDHQYPTTLLQQRVRGRRPREACPGRDGELEPAVLRACEQLRLPKDMADEMRKAKEIHTHVTIAMHEVSSRAAGKGKGKAAPGHATSRLTWGELVEAMRAKRPKTGEAAQAYYETTLCRVAALNDPGARPTVDEFSSAVFASCRVIEELVLGGKKAVDYDEWKRGRAAPAGAAAAAAAPA